MTSASGYRPEIDGLRAIAILAVVAFHAGLPGVPGGYLGVDVFFVISGYLITQLLLREAEQSGSIALGEFYARRVRRLLPALAAMTTATLVATLWLTTGLDFHADVGAALAAASLYASNLYFLAGEQRYFGAADDVHPLLHTWSLGVEEQFYLLWPALLAALFLLQRQQRWRALTALRMLTIVAVMASLLAAWAWAASDDLASFYHPAARAWELGLGAGLVAFATPLARLGAARGNAIGLGGMLSILIAIVAADPGLPVLGSMLAALGAAGLILGVSLAPAAPLTRALSTAPMVRIGLASYGWYLWHWPLLSFGRIALPDAAPFPRDLGLVVVALLLAELSLRWLEVPIRRRRPGGFATTAGTLRIGLAITVVGTVAGLGLNISATSALISQEFGVRVLPACRDRSPLADCTLGAAHGTPRAILLGDSHASQYLPLLEGYVRGHEVAFAARTRNTCPMLLDYDSEWDPRMRRACTAAGSGAWDELLALAAAATPDAGDGLRGVMLAQRWTARSGSAPLDRREQPEYERNLELGDAAGQARALEAALTASVRRARGAGLRVLLVAPTPEFARAVPVCLALGFGCDAERAQFESRRAPAMAMLRRAAGTDPDVRIWDPAAALCDAERCAADLAGRPRYRDDDHLSAWQARELLESARADLDWLAGD